MKNQCKCELQQFMAATLSSYRSSHNLTQEKMASKLLVDRRSYVALEHGDSLCCTLTLLYFLTFCCDNPSELLQEIRVILTRCLQGDDNDV